MVSFGAGSGSGCSATLILCGSESEDGPEDEAQENQAQCGAYATTEALRELVDDNQEHDDIHLKIIRAMTARNLLLAGRSRKSELGGVHGGNFCAETESSIYS